MKTVDIFIKSYHKDFKLLKYSLQSIKKNVSGYNNVILLIPEREKHLFDTRDIPERTLIHYVKEYGNGYLFQQWCKISAHKYSNADYILFSDSDCIFDHEINLQDFVKDEKPEILYTDYSKVGDAICWKEVTEAFIKEPQQFEWMRRNCLVYHRGTLERIAAYEPNLEYIIMSGNRFSEFNAIGAYAFKYEKDLYSFVNTDDWTYAEPKGIQLWSLATKDNANGEYERILQTLNKVFGLNLTEL